MRNSLFVSVSALFVLTASVAFAVPQNMSESLEVTRESSSSITRIATATYGTPIILSAQNDQADANSLLLSHWELPIPLSTTTMNNMFAVMHDADILAAAEYPESEVLIGVPAHENSALNTRIPNSDRPSPENTPTVIRRGSEIPVRVTAPSINLNSPIVGVGLDSKGRMDVPSGKTNNAGWYTDGTVPGRVGSAVVAAHVYAAFDNLHNLSPGADIYVDTEGGERLHFVVDEMITHRLNDMSPRHLFSRTDARRLNLITCAGAWSNSMGTYTHRLVVYAKYVGRV